MSYLLSLCVGFLGGLAGATVQRLLRRARSNPLSAPGRGGNENETVGFLVTRDRVLDKRIDHLEDVLTKSRKEVAVLVDTAALLVRQERDHESRLAEHQRRLDVMMNHIGLLMEQGKEDDERFVTLRRKVSAMTEDLGKNIVCSIDQDRRLNEIEAKPLLSVATTMPN